MWPSANQESVLWQSANQRPVLRQYHLCSWPRMLAATSSLDRGKQSAVTEQLSALSHTWHGVDQSDVSIAAVDQSQQSIVAPPP